jgi:3-deoxy-manno-octulosonate cytidylyltransferase (CMP-KDO synthetase)
MNPAIHVVVPVRLGSTRFPGKALVSVGGRSHLEKLILSIQEWADQSQVHIATDSEAVAFVASRAGCSVLLTGEAENGTARIAQAVIELDLAPQDWILNIQGDLVEVSRGTGRELTENLARAADVGSNWVTFADGRPWDRTRLGSNSGSVWIAVDGSNHGLMFGRGSGEEGMRADVTLHSHIGLYGYRKMVLERYLMLERTSNEIALSLEQFRLLDSGIQPFVGFLSEVPREINTEQDYIEEMLRAK